MLFKDDPHNPSAASQGIDSPQSPRDPISRILALPSELISSIAYATDALGDPTLLDLRLTCKLVHSCCDDAFLAGFFVDRWHMYTDYSLRVLYEISRSPRLRKRMSTLTLSYRAAEYMDLGGHTRRSHKAGLLCDTSVDSKPGGELGCLWNDRKRNQHAIEESCSKILEAALEALNDAKVIPAVYACSSDVEGRQWGSPYGMSTLKRHTRMLGLRTTFIAESLNNTAVSRTLVAIARTNFPIARLDISSPQGDMPCEPEAFGPMGAARNFPWADLVRLVTTIHSSNLRADLLKWTAFQSWLGSLRALQDLDIGFEWPERDSYGEEGPEWSRMLQVPPWRRLAECLEHAPLSKLRVGIGRFGRQGFLHLLESLASRLNSLELDSCTMVDSQSVWHDVFSWVADNMSLKRLNARCISNNCSDMITAAGHNEFTVAGSSDYVKTMLLQQVRSMTFTDDPASASNEAGDDEGSDAEWEDEYGPDFNDSDLQIADGLEPYG
ncbi:hypothetical protein LTR95_001594 [Oleoguttula sp. CCFEE 5521]